MDAMGHVEEQTLQLVDTLISEEELEDLLIRVGYAGSFTEHQVELIKLALRNQYGMGRAAKGRQDEGEVIGRIRYGQLADEDPLEEVSRQMETVHLDRTQIFDYSTLWMGRKAFVALLVCMVVAIAATILLGPWEWRKPDVATLIEGARGVHVERGDRSLKVGPGLPLKNGDRFYVAEGTTATLLYDDGTRIVITGDSELTLDDRDGAKHIDLKQGELDLHVAEQSPDRALTLRTPEGQVQVLGTRLRVTTAMRQTLLEVLDGSAKMVRVWDRDSVEVGTNEFAVAAEGVQMIARSMNSLPMN